MRALLLVFLATGVNMVAADEAPTAMYARLKAFALSPSAARADNVVFKRDRIEMNFSGVFYPEQPVEGKVRGAVFVGSGSIRISRLPFPTSVTTSAGC